MENFTDVVLLNIETIDQIRSFSPDDSIIKELFTSFINDSDVLVKNILDLVGGENADTLQTEVHTLKGVAGTIGASRLHEICKVLDANLKSADSSANQELSVQIDECYKELKEHILATYLS